jgi:hypothetical protein
LICKDLRKSTSKVQVKGPLNSTGCFPPSLLLLLKARLEATSLVIHTNPASNLKRETLNLARPPELPDYAYAKSVSAAGEEGNGNMNSCPARGQAEVQIGRWYPSF